jgi:hypothetical protein
MQPIKVCAVQDLVAQLAASSEVIMQEVVTMRQVSRSLGWPAEACWLPS